MFLAQEQQFTSPPSGFLLYIHACMYTYILKYMHVYTCMHACIHEPSIRFSAASRCRPTDVGMPSCHMTPATPATPLTPGASAQEVAQHGGAADVRGRPAVMSAPPAAGRRRKQQGGGGRKAAGERRREGRSGNDVGGGDAGGRFWSKEEHALFVEALDKYHFPFVGGKDAARSVGLGQVCVCVCGCGCVCVCECMYACMHVCVCVRARARVDAEVCM